MALHASRVTRKGQVTIPVEPRRKYHIEEGDTAYFEDRGDQVAIVRPEEIVSRTVGVFKEYAKNLPPLEPHQIRELAAHYIAEEVMQSMKDEADVAG